MITDRKYMQRCMELARKGTGRVSPNPRVGAVVVRDGEVIGEGYHEYFGGPHAEVNALRDLSPEQTRNAELYVNLEPCCFTGKTPACTDLILYKKVKRVIIGMSDPNPKVNGCGIAALRKAGIDITVGVMEKQCRELNRGYIKHITTGLPEVIVKTAMSLDGRLGTVTGDSRWITSKTARTFTHALRAEFDAILVGVRTVLTDNPMLNVRHVTGRNPLRVVVDSRLRTSLEANVANEQKELPTVFFCSEDVEEERRKPFIFRGCRVVSVPVHEPGYLSLTEILKHLGRMGVSTLLVEGGATVYTSFLQQKLADRLITVIAPKVIGADGVPVIGNLGVTKMSEVESWKFRKVKRMGEDVMVEIVLKEY